MVGTRCSEKHEAGIPLQSLSLLGGLRMNMPCASGFCTFVPVPLSAIAAGEFEALLTNETLCEAVLADCGANVNEKEALCPAARVRGKDRPLMENGAPMEGADEIVTFAPVALSVAVLVELLPTATLPKFIEDGEIES